MSITTHTFIAYTLQHIYLGHVWGKKITITQCHKIQSDTMCYVFTKTCMFMMLHHSSEQYSSQTWESSCIPTECFHLQTLKCLQHDSLKSMFYKPAKERTALALRGMSKSQA